MSAAYQLAPQEEIRSGGAPSQRPAVRPAPKKKRKFGALLAMTSVWAVLMGLSFALVQTNMAIREEKASMARMQEEIAQREQLNLQLQAEVETATSIAAVQTWASSHGMVAPAGPVPALKGKPEAVAKRQAPETAPVETAQAPRSLWQTLFARITGTYSQSADAAR